MQEDRRFPLPFETIIQSIMAN
ncbi:hypothetical protein NC652_040902 [Populus alba x Populus x berolinensis]|nr:hypothetical protein NC652_040902 [Populus alba x Populus x berolinensis]